jgi:FAD/FMN-containing dehydrogenase
MLTRRRFLAGGVAAWGLPACAPPPPAGRTAPGTLVNDIQGQLSPTRVARVVRPASPEDVRRVLQEATAEGRAVSVAGGRHAMGGQAFGEDTVLLDTTQLRSVLWLDAERGLVEAEAGIQWPELMAALADAQRGRPTAWGIVQKQTGADRLSLGGALAANVHGRGLRFRPIVQDVEAFVLVGADGELRRCSRRENPELFRLVIGGYGLFGVVTSVTLRLGARQKLERVVEVRDVDGLEAAFARRIADGFLYGDFQYATDPASDAFLRTGVFSCYRPVDQRTPMPHTQAELSLGDWQRLLYLSHADKSRAFAEYAAFYRATSGQLYWSDTHQLSLYVEDYHRALDRQLGATERGTEMISEIYVPRAALAAFLADVRVDFRADAVDLIYGTIRLVEPDGETALAWATRPWACVIFNLHVVHTPAGVDRAAAAFRRLIDHGLRHGGSYYLTYHRWATRRQVDAAYPGFADVLRAKRRLDPAERFQSEWYRHYRTMFADAQAARPAVKAGARM